MLLVRHGESTWNAVRRWQGQADPPLSVVGEQQARDARHRAADLVPFDRVVTSTLRRARQTGELLAGGLGLELGDAVPELAERAAGEWEGLTRVEIEERYPGYLAQERRPPGYEADADVVERATRAVLDLVSSHDGHPLLVVSHGGVINALERADGSGWVRVDNLEGRWFEVADDRLRPVEDRVALLGDGARPSPSDPSYA